jgi:hypothetical protein
VRASLYTSEVKPSLLRVSNPETISSEGFTQMDYGSETLTKSLVSSKKDSIKGQK